MKTKKHSSVNDFINLLVTRSSFAQVYYGKYNIPYATLRRYAA